MKRIFNIAIIGLLFIILKAPSYNDSSNDNNSSNSNFCSPTIVVKSKSCNKKAKIIYKTKIVRKIKVVNKVKTVVKVKKVNIIKKVYKKRKKNIIKGFLGRSDTNVVYNRENDTANFDKGFVFGVGYQRFYSEDNSVELSYLSNDTLIFGLGFGF